MTSYPQPLHFLSRFSVRMLLVLICFSSQVVAQQHTGLSFDGKNDYIEFDPLLARELSNKQQLTLEVRVAFNDLKSFSSVFSFRQEKGNRKSYTLDLQTSGGGGKYFATNISNGKEDFRIATETPIVIGREYLLSLVFDGTQANPTDRTQLYIDGVRQYLSGGEDAPAVTSDLDESTPVYLGREKNRYSEITVSELRLWKTARTASEIASLASTEVTGPTNPDIAASYSFTKQVDETDRNKLRTLEEESGSGYGGTLNNFALSGGSSTWVGMAVIMPVDLVSFTGGRSGDNNGLEWTVANERNFSHYEIERSTTGTDNWMVMEEFLAQAADETAAFTYSYIDYAPRAGAYYRLRMVDLDGTVKLSEVVFLNRSEAGNFEVFPNPAIDHVTVSVPAEERVFLQLTDGAGRRVWTKELPAGTAAKAVIATDAAPGLYILTARTERQSWSQRLVIR